MFQKLPYGRAPSLTFQIPKQTFADTNPWPITPAGDDPLSDTSVLGIGFLLARTCFEVAPKGH